MCSITWIAYTGQFGEETKNGKLTGVLDFMYKNVSNCFNIVITY